MTDRIRHTHYKNTQQSGGYVLLLAAVMASLITALGVTISALMSSNLQLSGSFAESERSFFAASAVYECARYYDDSDASGGTFDDPTGSVTISCMGDTATDNGVGGGVRDFFFDWGTASNALCSRLRVYKDITAVSTTTVLTAFGYNTDCASRYSDDGSVVERVIQARY